MRIILNKKNRNATQMSILVLTIFLSFYCNRDTNIENFRTKIGMESVAKMKLWHRGFRKIVTRDHVHLAK